MLFDGLTPEQVDAKIDAMSEQEFADFQTLLLDINDWESWVKINFSQATKSEFAPRHRRLWGWFEALAPGKVVRPHFEIWARGGAKTSTVELGITYVAARQTRSFVLIVSSTQLQANQRVKNIAAHLLHIGIGAAVDEYGTRKGWSRYQLQTESGIIIVACGLDADVRGIMVENFRPDLIVLDDIDSPLDTEAIIATKIENLTGKLLPAGSSDCAILCTQNLIHENSIVNQIYEDRVDFLANAEIPAPEPAIIALKTELRYSEEYRRNINVIIAGTPTWDGQGLETCQKQIIEWGLKKFLREAQHEVGTEGGYFFDTAKFQIVEYDDLPKDRFGNLVELRVCLAGDLAATEGGGDYTVFVLMGTDGGQYYVLGMIRGRWHAGKVRRALMKSARRTKEAFENYTIRLPQDPGQGGLAQKYQLQGLLSDYRYRFVFPTGTKAVRARGYADAVNDGNVKILRGPWNHDFIDEHRRFRETKTKGSDDIIDSSSDAFNELSEVSTEVHTSLSVNPKFKSNKPKRHWFEVQAEDRDEDAGEFTERSYHSKPIDTSKIAS